jgi:hypothetical protein
MIVKLITVAAASMTITACSAQVAQTDGYLYPDLAKTLHSLTDTDYADSPGIWLFPPDEGGNN